MASNFEIDVPEDRWSNQNWLICEGLMVTFSTTGTVPSDRFQKFLDTLRTRDVTHLLSISEGSSTVDSVQRKISAEIAKEKSIKIAVILDSAITRGLITAYSWLGVNIKSYGPGKVEDALKYLDAPGVNVAQALEAVEQLRQSSLSQLKKYPVAR